MTCLICPCIQTRSCQPCDGSYNNCRLCQGSKPNGWWSPEEAIGRQDLSGKTYMITGANAGIGFATAQTLLAAGAEVIISTRSTAKTKATITRLIEGLPSGAEERAKGVSLDLSSLSSVEAGVGEFKALGVQRLDALCLNAGVMRIPEFTETQDGLEMQWGVNHVGHFHLVTLLLPTIHKLTGHTRIVVVGSSGHRRCPGDFTVKTHLPPKPETYDAAENYGISKMCNLLFARELAKRFDGKGISAYSLHPGVIVGTSLMRHMPSFVPCLFNCCSVIHCCCCWHADYKTVPRGASTSLFLMTQPLNELSAGGYYAGCRLQTQGSPLYNYAIPENAEEAKNLWELTERIISEKVVDL